MGRSKSSGMGDGGSGRFPGIEYGSTCVCAYSSDLGGGEALLLHEVGGDDGGRAGVAQQAADENLNL